MEFASSSRLGFLCLDGFVIGHRLCRLADQNSVPHIALLGSGGGERATVAMLGSTDQLVKEGLFDTLLYTGGISGSTW